MSITSFEENKHTRDAAGRFDEKPQTDPEATLPEAPDFPQVAGPGEPFSTGIQEALFPADWTDDDFPAAEPHIDAYFAQPDPSADEGTVPFAEGARPF